MLVCIDPVTGVQTICIEPVDNGQTVCIDPVDGGQIVCIDPVTGQTVCIDPVTGQTVCIDPVDPDCQSASCDITVGECPSASCTLTVENCVDCTVEAVGGCKNVLVKSCKLDDCLLCCDPHKSGFLWNNWCLKDGAELVATGEASPNCDSFDPIDGARNACDCSFTESWKFRGEGRYTITVPDSMPLDAVIIWGHNLYLGSDDVNFGRVTVWDETGAPIQPLNWDLPYATVDSNDPVLMYFDGTPRSSITIGFSGAQNNALIPAGDCNLALPAHCVDNIFIGQCMDIPEGLRQLANPFNASEYEAKIKASECGPLSRKLKRKAIDFELTLEGLCYDWLVEYWRPFLCYLQRYPVYFSWSKNRYPDEVARVWLDGCVEPSEFTDSHFSSISLSLQAQITQGKK